MNAAVKKVVDERTKDGAFVFRDPKLDADLHLIFDQIKNVRGAIDTNGIGFTIGYEQVAIGSNADDTRAFETRSDEVHSETFRCDGLRSLGPLYALGPL